MTLCTCVEAATSSWQECVLNMCEHMMCMKCGWQNSTVPSLYRKWCFFHVGCLLLFVELIWTKCVLLLGLLCADQLSGFEVPSTNSETSWPRLPSLLIYCSFLLSDTFQCLGNVIYGRLHLWHIQWYFLWQKWNRNGGFSVQTRCDLWCFCWPKETEEHDAHSVTLVSVTPCSLLTC